MILNNVNRDIFIEIELTKLATNPVCISVNTIPVSNGPSADGVKTTPY